MNIIKKLFGLLYKVYIILRERFFLIPPPETHPPQPSSFIGEGMGEEVLEEERTGGFEIPPLPETHPPQPSSFMGEGMGEDEFQQTGVGANGRSPLHAEKEPKDFEIPPLLEDQRISLCETLDRVLNTGVVVHGDITISVANIDLIYIGLRALLTSVETARQSGINHDRFLN